MVSSSKVQDDLSSITSKVSKYSSYVENLSNDWKGSSYDNILNKSSEVSSNYLSVLEKQMNAFAAACDLYEKYKEQKSILNQSNNALDNAKKDEDTSVIEANIAEAKKNINELKEEINTHLSDASSKKLEKSKVAGASFGEFVNYYQYNYSQPYSEGTIATSGCGPTSLAMCLTYITGKKITPVKTAELGNGTYTCSDGTYWTYFHDISKEFGVDCTQRNISSDNIKKYLTDGKPIIVSMGPGTFTSSGHFIVLTGYDKNGKIKVADPNSEERSKKSYDIDLIVREGKQIFTF